MKCTSRLPKEIDVNNPERTAARPTLSIPTRPGLDTFHFVWGEGRRAPRQRHETREAAIREAERLSALHPDIRFHVFTARRIATRRSAVGDPAT